MSYKFNSTKYTTSYINIDSTNRKKTRESKESYTINKTLLLRSTVINEYGNKINYFLMNENDDYMAINANANGFKYVSFDGFIGDKKTECRFNLQQYELNIIKNTDTYVIQINEDVLGDVHMHIAEFTINLYGVVVDVCDNIKNTINWGSQTITEDYYIDANKQIELNNITFTLPTTVYKIMEYFNKVQNIIRPIFLSYMNTPGSSFNITYKTSNRTYPIEVNIINEPIKMTTNMIGNIPTNTLNTKHKILTGKHIENFVKNHFYVKLYKPYMQKQCEIINPLQSNILIFYTYDESKYDVTIDYIYHNEITELQHETQPNNYIIELEKTYTNIVMVRMVSSYFPITHKIITKNNNHFYWQYIDGEINKIEIPIGNYTLTELKTEIEKLQQNIIIHIDEKKEFISFTNYNIYENYNIFEKFLLIETTDEYYQYPNGEYFKTGHLYNNNTLCIRILHLNHALKNGQQIIIYGSINYGYIPEKYINGCHTVFNVKHDCYDIILNNINYDETLNKDACGGYNIKIFEPALFRILNEANTFINLLGFKNVNTTYQYTIINNGSINLNTPPYLLMCCENLNMSNNLGSIKDYFYKINLFGYGYIYDSFVDIPIIINEPIRNLSQLKIDIYQPNGKYYDFYDKEHSFVLEIVTQNE